MEKEKNKKFVDLSESQKRRRLRTIRNQISNVGTTTRNLNDSESTPAEKPKSNNSLVLSIMDISKNNNLFDKYKIRVSSRGRSIISPKNIMTTSDDEPVKKKSKNTLCSEKLLEELEKDSKAIRTEKQNKESPQLPDIIGTKKLTDILADIKARNYNNELKDKLPFSCCENVGDKSTTDFSGDQFSPCYEQSPALIDDQDLFQSSSNLDSDHTLPIHEEAETNADDVCGDFPESDTKFRSFVLKSLMNLERKSELQIQQNKQILQLLSTLNSGGENLSGSLYEPLTGFPIKTVAEFDDLNSDSSKDTRQKVHDHLVRLGGSKLREFLNSALKEIMVDELVTKYTWHKQQETEKFGDTRVSNVLYQAAKKCPLFKGPENKTEFKAAMLDVLKSTKQRFRKKQARTRTEPSITEDIIKKKIQELRDMMNKESPEDADISDDDDEDFE